MPWADTKSVPVFFKDCMAARTACTIATQETREKTGYIISLYISLYISDNLLIILAPIASASLDVKDGVSPPEITFTRT